MAAPATDTSRQRLPSDDQRDHLLVQVAKMYFQLDRTQADIAQALGLTRWQVGRLLSEARETGIVRIEIAPRANRIAALEAALQRHWRLRDAVVVPSDGDSALDAGAVAQAAATWLAGLADKPPLIGVSWGRTMAAVARALPAGWNPDAHVVLVNGATALRLTSPGIGTVAESFAQSAGGTATLLPAPAILGRAETRAALEADPVIAAALALARKAPLVIFGMGAMEDSALAASGFLSETDIAELRRQGAVGDILGRFLTARGAIVDPALDARTLGLRPDTLAMRRHAVGVVSGPAKQAIALAALRARLLNVLVTDEQTARHLLAPNPEQPHAE
ncbi:sugar-binding transcriptional regulator [Gemmobacter sp.]|uniref:sugar-binding transcriptional regulator n=1 Tax=Gemmobacter sp. TaxID=1898957 RepID=UPI002AFED187|nr:sugar-binding domain-containing protein [Gemmobacter sp.]